MTKDEALQILDTIPTISEQVDALEMAIKALEQQPCDAISREAALEKMADYVASGYADSAEDFKEYSRIICQLPPVTPQQKYGKWILTIEDWNKWTCSKCGYVKRTDIHVNIGWKFCPSCGCRMVEPQESEEISDRNMKMWEGIFKAERRNE